MYVHIHVYVMYMYMNVLICMYIIDMYTYVLVVCSMYMQYLVVCMQYIHTYIHTCLHVCVHTYITCAHTLHVHTCEASCMCVYDVYRYIHIQQYRCTCTLMTNENLITYLTRYYSRYTYYVCTCSQNRTTFRIQLKTTILQHVYITCVSTLRFRW